jgi:ribosomal protein S18 acetylase RimI-like enzyme
MGSAMMYRDLAGEPDPERFVPLVLPWVIDAGRPYYDWMFGEQAPSWVGRWMRRPSSEVAIRRTAVAELDAEIAGGYIALDGDELCRCRLADAVALIAESPDSEESKERIHAAQDVFATVPAGTSYLSKFGLLRSYRGRGLAGDLLEHWLAQARANGSEHLQLDVFEGNDRAVRLYEDAGFTVVSRSLIPGTSVAYLAMALRW